MKYKVIVLPEKCEEQWEPDPKLQRGLKCDGIFMITFAKGKPQTGARLRVNMEELKKALKHNSPEILQIRAAFKMAEAEIEAEKMIEACKGDLFTRYAIGKFGLLYEHDNL